MKVQFNFSLPTDVQLAVLLVCAISNRWKTGEKRHPDYALQLFLGVKTHGHAANGQTAEEIQRETIDRWVPKESREGILRLWTALTAYFNGAQVVPEYSDIVQDDSFHADDGVVVDSDGVEVWVYNSRVCVTRGEKDREFCFWASGVRPSFEQNVTGDIARAIIDACARRPLITDVVVESQTPQPWDNELRALFERKLSTKVRHVLFGENSFAHSGLLSGVYSSRIQALARELAAALDDPEEGHEHNMSLPSSRDGFLLQDSSSGGDGEEKKVVIW